MEYIKKCVCVCKNAGLLVLEAVVVWKPPPNVNYLNINCFSHTESVILLDFMSPHTHESCVWWPKKTLLTVCYGKQGHLVVRTAPNTILVIQSEN